MDAFDGAFAYYDWDDTKTALIYTPGTVRPKMLRNSSEFPDGYVTTDDSWVNNWIAGQNAAIGWHGATSGYGLKSWGTMLTQTDAFATCMPQHAVEAMCLHAPTTPAELAAVQSISQDFKKDYNMKNVFAEAAVFCSQE